MARFIAKLCDHFMRREYIGGKYKIEGQISHRDFCALYLCKDRESGEEIVIGVPKCEGKKTLSDICRLYPMGKSYPVNLDRHCELKVRLRFKDRDACYVLMYKKKRRIGRYELLYERDKGSMGIIYKAKDLESGNICALKELGDRDLEKRIDKRMLQEGHLLKNLNHPYILKVQEVFTWRGKLYLAMDYIPGENLADLIRRGPMASKMALQFIGKVAGALAYIHKGNIIHRDIKPGNIMIDSNLVPQLMDFGIAKILHGQSEDEGQKVKLPECLECSATATIDGEMVGTPRYMAPELVKIFHDPDAEYSFDNRIDIFALGVTLAEMLSGEYPFTKKRDHMSVFWSILKDPSPTLPGQDRGSQAINRLLSDMLAKEPAQRLSSMDEVIERIDEILANFPLKSRLLAKPGEKIPKPAEKKPKSGKKFSLPIALFIAIAVIAGIVIVRLYFPQLLPRQIHDAINALVKIIGKSSRLGIPTWNSR